MFLQFPSILTRFTAGATRRQGLSSCDSMHFSEPQDPANQSRECSEPSGKVYVDLCWYVLISKPWVADGSDTQNCCDRLIPPAKAAFQGLGGTLEQDGPGRFVPI